MAAEPDWPDPAAAPGPRPQAKSPETPPEDSPETPPETPPGKPERADAGSGAKRGKRKRPFWRELAVVIVAALVLTILLKAFVVQVFSIPSGSMENTLVPGDRVLVNKLVYRFRPIARGDIVVFSGQGSWDPPAPPPSGDPLVRLWHDVTNLVGISAPGTDYIKRVIGLPGDHVACCDAQGRVTVNGVPLNEQSYIYPGDAPSQVPFSVTVPPGRLWVMGDNRADSDDSRYRMDDPGDGTIPESAVVGRAFVVIWPPGRWGLLNIPATFQQAGLVATAAVTTVAAATAAPALPAVGGGACVALAAGITYWRQRRNGARTGTNDRPG